MNKINKLKEVNTKIKKIIGELETSIFVQKINIHNNKFIMDYNRNVNNLK